LWHTKVLREMVYIRCISESNIVDTHPYIPNDKELGLVFKKIYSYQLKWECSMLKFYKCN